MVPPRLPPATRRGRRDRQHRRQLGRRRDRAPDAAEALGRRSAAPRARHPGRGLPVPRLDRDRDPEGVDPVPDDGALPGRAGGDRPRRLSRPRALLRRPRRVLPRRARRAVRRGLPVRAARRHQPRLPLRPRDALRRRGTGRRPERASARLRRTDQLGDRRPPGRLGRRDPPLPRQLPQHVVRPGRLRARRRGPLQRARRRRLLPRVRRRTVRRLRAPPLRTRRQDRRARSDDQQAPGAGVRRRARRPRRRGVQVRPARPALPQPAVRLRQHGRGQPTHRRPAVGQAVPGGRGGGEDLGL